MAPSDISKGQHGLCQARIKLLDNEIASTTTYVMHSDPGHAWLQVPILECRRLGVTPSGYSYKYKESYYLEEDCDAPAFIDAKIVAGEPYSIKECHLENTPIRNYRSAP